MAETDAGSMTTMTNPWTAARGIDALYWKDRAEKAEEELERLRAEVERLRDAGDAVYLIGKVLGVTWPT